MKKLVKYSPVYLGVALAAVLSACCCNSQQAAQTCGVIVATDFVANDGKVDVSDALQKLIDDNPNRTIYFPDGTYLLSKSLKTPADPKKSVSLKLSNFAVLKAADTWSESEAVVRLGAIHPANNIRLCGSLYGIDGGIIDCSGKANGVSVDGGRETFVRNLSIKNAKIGVHIKLGANSGSSDADVRDVNATGTNSADSIGLLVEGYDNTFTNMRMASFHTGVVLKSQGNSLRNIHPLYIFVKNGKERDMAHYESSVGFFDQKGGNWHDYSYSDQFATGFKLANQSVLSNCFIFWYNGNVKFQTAIESMGKLECIVNNPRVGFRGKTAKKTILVAEQGGCGIIQNLIGNAPRDYDAAKYYLKGIIIP